MVCPNVPRGMDADDASRTDSKPPWHLVPPHLTCAAASPAAYAPMEAALVTRKGTTGWKAAISCCPAFLQQIGERQCERLRREAGRWAGGDERQNRVLTAATRAPARLAATTKSLSCCRPMATRLSSKGGAGSSPQRPDWAVTLRDRKLIRSDPRSPEIHQGHGRIEPSRNT